MMVQAEEGGVVKVKVADGYQKQPAISDEMAQEIARLLIALEETLGKPQDFEWAVEGDTLYCLQTRPIVTLPPSCFYDNGVLGRRAVLWDNSNIVESYAGVTSPLTFSFAAKAYEQVGGWGFKEMGGGVCKMAGGACKEGGGLTYPPGIW